MATNLGGGVPANADSLVVVIQNTCGQTYTFSIDHVFRSLAFEGEGDLLDSKYDKWLRGTTYEEFAQLIGVVSTLIPVSNATVPPASCLHRFQVYPSHATEEKYFTIDPVIFAVVSALIFLFTSFVFFYDTIVRRRQQ
jgi:hypothetical protein